MSIRWIWWAVPVIVCFWAPALGTAQEPKTAAEFFKRGVLCTDKGESDKAIKDYTEAIRLDPKDAVAFTCRVRGPRRVNTYEGDRFRNIGSVFALPTVTP